MDLSQKVPQAVRSFWERYVASKKAAGPHLIAVSGGVDSLTLLHALIHTLPESTSTLIAVTFEHGLRPESRAEAEAMQALIQSWGVPAHLTPLPIQETRSQTGQSVELTARNLRYQALAVHATAVGASAVLVGHQADDQVESILMHLVRGSGLHGLRGMAPVSNWPLPLPDGTHSSLHLMRPLLTCWRKEINAYAQTHQLQPLTDPTNDDQTFTRNRFRHTVVPLLETVNPQVKQNIFNLGLITAADLRVLEEQHSRAWETVIVSQDGRWISGDLAAWRSLDLSHQRAVVRRALRQAGHKAAGRTVSFDQVERLVTLLQRGGTGQHSSTNTAAAVFIYYNRFFIGPGQDPSLALFGLPQLQKNARAIDMDFRANQIWPLAFGWHIRRDPSATEERPRADLPYDHATLSLDPVADPIQLRGRQAGDFLYFRDGEANIRKMTVKSFFINQKIPRPLRDRWPLLARGSEILWVVGLRVGAVISKPTATQTLFLHSEEFLG